MSTSTSAKDRLQIRQTCLTDHVLSWSLADTLDPDLFRPQVTEIPMRFSSAEDYLNSFKIPLLEETHADILSVLTSISSAPLCLITSIRHIITVNTKYCFYTMTVKGMKHKQGEAYRPAISDLIALTTVKPKCIDDMLKPLGRLIMGLVTNCQNDRITVKFPMCLDGSLFDDHCGLRGVLLMNMTTNLRIWKALLTNPESMRMDIIKSVLQPNTREAEALCTECQASETVRHAISESQSLIRPYHLNDSQKAAVLSCMTSSCCTHMNTVKLIWGPPGTGKTKTVSVLLYALLNKKVKTLVCAPTNIAVLEVAGRLMKMIKESEPLGSSYGLGDVVVSGNRERMKIDEGNDVFLDVFLNHRLQVLGRCFNKSSGWQHCMNSLINLLEKNMNSFYKSYVASETQRQTQEHKSKLEKEKQLKKVKNKNMNIQEQKSKLEKEEQSKKVKDKNIQIDLLTFKEFMVKEFNEPIETLTFCIKNLYTHLPTSFISPQVANLMVKAVELLKSFRHFLSEGLEVSRSKNFSLKLKQSALLIELESLFADFSLPEIKKGVRLKDLCVDNAIVVFCTASGSSTLKAAFEMVVIDEAAQLKECESAIPLQGFGLCHAVLVGDERQLPAMVKSNISDKANFGRSLFQRLVLLGYQKHLLNIQYRMHPSISQLPNKAFYNNLIRNAPNVCSSNYERRFLQENMYGSYSFINIPGGQEEMDGSRSSRNFVEVASIIGIVKKLSKACETAREKVSVGVISPYKAQTSAIQSILAERQALGGHVSVNVRSVDGFQGGEEDIIIFSSVRCNDRGIIGFLSNPQRTNVALTRARHCLWVLGNACTLLASNSIWEQVVQDAKDRGSFHDVMEDKELLQSISDNLLELGRHDLLLNTNSVLFVSSNWKVHFSSNFRKSMAQTLATEAQKKVLLLLGKLSNGWRDKVRSFSCLVTGVHASQVLEIYNLCKGFYVAWSIDISYENGHCSQVLKVWDVVRTSHVMLLDKHVDALLRNYTPNEMERCKYRCMEGGIQVPMSWGSATSDDDEYYDDSEDLLSSALATLDINEKPNHKWGGKCSYFWREKK